jgi:hypothetical protein
MMNSGRGVELKSRCSLATDFRAISAMWRSAAGLAQGVRFINVGSRGEKGRSGHCDGRIA